MVLRPYQTAAVEALRDAFRRGHRSPLLVAPTGSGKTVIFSEIVRGASGKGTSVLILTHREEILQQTSAKLTQAGVRHGIIASGREQDQSCLVQVASVQTLVRRLDSVQPPKLIVVDEAHHAAAGSWDRVFKQWPTALRIGVSATPERLDGRGLSGQFDWLVLGPSVDELQRDGYLVRTRCYGPIAQVDTTGLRARAGEFETAALAERASKVTGNAVHEYRERSKGRRAVAFCVSVAHAEATAAAFSSAGIPSTMLDGSLRPEARAARIADFSAGRVMVMSSCDIVSEGFDLPSIETVIGLRPTKSLSLHLQMIGRALRPAPGKSEALIIDHAGNIARHGFAEDHHAWTLEGKASRKQKEVEPISHRCKRCYAMWPSGAACPQCGMEIEAKPREVKLSAGELQELKRAESKAKSLEQGKAGTMKELIALGYQRKYKNPHAWASYIFQSRQRRA